VNFTQVPQEDDSLRGTGIGFASNPFLCSAFAKLIASKWVKKVAI